MISSSFPPITTEKVRSARSREKQKKCFRICCAAPVSFIPRIFFHKGASKPWKIIRTNKINKQMTIANLLLFYEI